MIKPPARTRSYLTAERIVAREHFTLNIMLQSIAPSASEYTAMRLGAAVIGAFDVSRGRKSQVISPCTIIDYELTGHSNEHEPAWSDRDLHKRSIKMLRCVARLNSVFAKVESFTDTDVPLLCPVCGRDTIVVSLNDVPVWDADLRQTIKYEIGMISMKSKCNCKNMRPQDLHNLEKKALEVAFEQFE